MPFLSWIVIAFLAIAPALVEADTLSGRVVGVSDGDTITVLDADFHQYKIRLSGIDAPEKKQAFGQRSKEHLSQLVFNKPVDVEWNKLDRYKRTIGKVMVADPSCTKTNCPKTIDVGLSQITVGLAWWYRKYAREQIEEDRQRYEFAETEAKARRAGLWSEKESVPPWEWRHKTKNLPEITSHKSSHLNDVFLLSSD